MSKWINYILDSRLVAVPFLQKERNGGKGFFLNSDKLRCVLLGGSTYIGGRSYPSYFPPFHQPRHKMFYD